jgi:hypothetical protein
MTVSTDEPRPLSLRLLLWAGVIGPLLFIAVFLVEGATRPDYDPVRFVVSSLSLSSQGWMQIANFIIAGSFVFAFSFGLRRVLHSGKGSTWGPILIGVVGIGLVASGLFVMDPPQGYPPGALVTTSVHGTVHEILGALVFTAVPVACFVLARRFLVDPAWRGWAVYSIVTGVLLVILIVVMKVVQLSPDPNAPLGLVQRFFIIAGWVWISLVAFSLTRKAPPRG